MTLTPCWEGVLEPTVKNSTVQILSDALFINQSHAALLARMVDEEGDVIQNCIFVISLTDPKLIPIPIELFKTRDDESALSNLIQEDMGSLHLVRDTILYQQPYCILNSVPPYPASPSGLNDEFEELFRVELARRTFHLVARSSAPLAVIGDHIYHCDDLFSDSGSSGSSEELDLENLEIEDDCPEDIEDMSINFDRTRFFINQNMTMEKLKVNETGNWNAKGRASSDTPISSSRIGEGGLHLRTPNKSRSFESVANVVTYGICPRTSFPISVVSRTVFEPLLFIHILHPAECINIICSVYKLHFISIREILRWFLVAL